MGRSCAASWHWVASQDCAQKPALVTAPHQEVDKPGGRDGLKKLLKVRCANCDNNVGHVQSLCNQTFWFLTTKADSGQNGVAYARTELRGTTVDTPFRQYSKEPWKMDLLATALGERDEKTEHAKESLFAAHTMIFQLERALRENLAEFDEK